MTRPTRAALLMTCALAASGGGAYAADLGGNCCADLEERIAELEATTARKGNRKVSLTVTGYVAQEITYWGRRRTKQRLSPRSWPDAGDQR
jgi:hypothetical protein